METVLSRPTKAGLPPWLFFALLIMIIRLPQTVEYLRGSFADDETIAEQNRILLADAKIEDPFERFHVKLEKFPYDKEWKDWLDKEHQESAQWMKALDEWLKSGGSAPEPPRKTIEFKYQKELDAWMEKQKREQEQQNKSIQEWLLGGATARFRRDGAAAMAEIDRAQHIDEKQKALARDLVKSQRNIIAGYLDELEDKDLREAVRRETGLDPGGTDKAVLIDYLLEVDASKRTALSRDWARISGAKPVDLSKLGDAAGEWSVDAWRAKFSLFMMWPSMILELGILIVPLVGFRDVFFPHIRQRSVERRCGLTKHSGEFPEVNEMAEFVVQHVPRLDIRVNLIKPGPPFVYPADYRRPCLAILNDLYKLWRRDREKAKEILLHELEHVRQGDYLLVGYGSVFPQYLKWIAIGAVGITLIEVAANIIFSIASVGFDGKHQSQLMGLMGGMAVGLPGALISMALIRIVTPLFGIWASEFNADYGAARGKATPLNPNMAPAEKRGVLTRWFGGLTHPPLWLRTWLAAKNTWLRDAVRHLIFPSAYLVLLFVLILFGLFAKLPGDGFKVETLLWLLGLAWDAFARQYWVFGGMAVLLLAWPLLAPHWERFFTGKDRAYASWDAGRSLASLVLAALGVLGYWMGPSS